MVMAEIDNRWIQRFDNFKRAFLILENSVSVESPSLLEQGGIIQFFEMTLELAWKRSQSYVSYLQRTSCYRSC